MIEVEIKFNFIDYLKLKKILIKRTMTKCVGKINCKGRSEFLKGFTVHSRWREREREMAVDIKLKTQLVHV